MKIKIRTGALLLALFYLSVNAQQKAQNSFTPGTGKGSISLEDIFKNRKYQPAAVKAPAWEVNGHCHIELRPATQYPGQPNVKEVWVVDPVKNRAQLLIAADRLKPAGATLPLRIRSVEFSDNMQAALLTTLPGNSSTGRQESWLLDLSDWYLKKINAGGVATLRNITISPDRKKIAFCSNNNIYMEDMRSSTGKQLTTDGSRDIINGHSSANLATVLSVRGIKWSPDSRFIAYTRFDTRGVRELILINNTDSLYPFIKKQQYVKPGETLPSCTVGIVDIVNGQTQWCDIPVTAGTIISPILTGDRLRAMS